MNLFAQALFAQRGGGGAGGGADAAGAAGALGTILCIYGVILAVAIAVQIMFLLSVSRCLQQVSPRNRQMEPGQVWLALIPIFGFVWIIIMVIRVADSLKDEYYDRGMRGDGDFGKTLGIVYIVSSVICGPVGLVCWIMYWVKIAGYTKELQARGRRASHDEDDEDDYEDDRPRRRRRSRRDEDEDEDEE